MDDFSGSDFETAASATASPDTTSAETTSAGSASLPPASETTTETAATGPASTAGSPGEPPKEKWEHILENARAKATEAAIAKWREQHGWAETVDRSAVERMGQIAKLYQQDRAGYVRQILAEAVQDPTLAPVVRSEAARILGARRSEPDLSPDIPVVDESGRVVNQSYSADRMRQVVAAEIAKALGEKVDPLVRDHEQRQAERAHAAQMQSFETETQRIYTTVSTLPHYADHEPAIAQALATIPPEVPANEAALLAYVSVVIPQLSTTERKKVLADLNKKPGASTVSPSGGTAGVAIPDSQKSWEQVFEEEARRMGL